MNGIAILALVLFASDPPAFGPDLTFGGQAYSLVESGDMKAKSLIGSVAIFDFAKYKAPDSQLLVIRLARKLTASQIQQVFRGVVRDRTGSTDAQLQAFLALLPAGDKGSTLQFRSRADGMEVFAGEKRLGSVDAPQLGAAIWAGFSGTPAK